MVTSRETVTVPLLPGALGTDRLAIENVVYESPNPNGNSGVSLCASYHR